MATRTQPAEGSRTVAQHFSANADEELDDLQKALHAKHGELEHIRQALDDVYHNNNITKVEMEITDVQEKL